MKPRPLSDFEPILARAALATPVALIGGHAVGWWARNFQDRITAFGRVKKALPSCASQDLDFVGDVDTVKALSRALNTRARWPRRYEMTILVGLLPITLDGEPTTMEILHTVPGLDVDIEEALAPAAIHGGLIRVLEPVSLALSKAHGLLNYPQEERNDNAHCRVCVACCRCVIEDLLADGKVESAHEQCERLLHPAETTRGKKLWQRFQINLADGIPLDAFRAAARATVTSPADRDLIRSFLDKRWPRAKTKMLDYGWKPGATLVHAA